MPNTIISPQAQPKITHDPTRVLSGNPLDVIGDNPFAAMTEEIIFGGANSLLQIIDDVTGLDLLPAAKLLEDALGSAFGGAGFTNFVSYVEGFGEGAIDAITGLPIPSVNPTGLFSNLISWVTSGFGLLDPAESLIKQLLSGAGSLGSSITDWAAHFNPADIFTAPGIFHSIMNAGKFLGGLIPALDASIIQTGHFAMSLITGLEDALAGAGTGFANIVKALVPGSAGLIDDLGVWEQNLMSGDWMRQFGSALTGLHAPTIKDIEDWANGVRKQAQKISVADIFDLPDLNIFNVGQIAKPTTTPNLLSNSNFALPYFGIAPWKWEGPQLFCFTVGGTGEPVGTGHASQVGSVIAPADWNWVPVSYAAAMYPMADSIADGIEKLVAAIQSTPAGSKIAGVAVSQGAVVWSKVWEDEFVATGGRLHSRMNDVVAVTTFGNPRRKAGSHAPGTPDPGGHGIAATDLQTNVPSWWYDYANPDDIVPTVATGTGGDFASLLYDFLVNDWDGAPETLIADVISTLGNPLGTLSSLYRMVAMVAGDAWKSLTGNNPHTTYNTVKIDGTNTSVELAVAYLNTVGAANVGVLGTTFQSNGGAGSGSISVSCNGTWQEWDHPELISVTPDQTLTLACDLMGTSISTTGGNNFRIVLERLLNGAHVDYVYPVSSTATGTFAWTTLTGTYVVPSSGVDQVRVGVAATNAATFGTYHVDNLTLTKTGLLPRSHVNGLQTLVSNLFGGFDTIGSLLQVPAIPSLDASKIVTGLFDALRIPSLDASKITSGILGALRIPDITKAMSSDLQTTISNLFGTTSIGTLLQVPAIPSLDASKITTGLLNALRIPNLPASIINTGTFLSSLIPNLNASIINAGTFLSSLIPSLDATKITTGIFGTGQIPNITKAMSTDLLKVFNLQAVRNAAGPNMATDPTCSNAAMWPTIVSGGALSISTAQFRSSPSSLKNIISATQFGSFPLLYDTGPTTVNIPVVGGRTYYAEYWIKSDAANVGSTLQWMLQFQCSDSTGVNTLLQTNKGILTPNSSGWQKVSGYYTIPASGYDRLIIVATYGSGGTVSDAYYFDDISIYEVTEAQNVVQSLFGTIGSALTGAIQSLKIPSLDATKITTGVFGSGLIPDITAAMSSGVTSLMSNLGAGTATLAAITTRLGKIASTGLIDATTALSGLLPTGNIPGLDVSKIVSGIFGAGFIPSLDATKITTGQFVSSLIPNLNASIINAGTFLSSLIPNLNASIINAGTFLSSLIPSLDATKITTGIFGTGQIPNITKAMSTDIQGVIDNVYQAINGGTSINNTVASIKTALSNIPGSNVVSALAASVIPALDAAKIATGQFVSSLIPNLNASIINAGTFLSSLIPSLDATRITTGTFLSSLIPNLNASIINAGTFINSVIPNITKAMSSDLQTTISNLFGTTSIGTTVQTPAIPLLSATKIDPSGGRLDQQNIPDVQAWMSTDTQTIIDSVHQVANGGGSTGNPASSIVDNLTKIIAPPANPSTATAVTVQSIGAGNQQNNTNSFVTASTNWTHTIGSTANMLVVAVVWESGPISNVGGTAGFVRQVLCGTSAGTGTPMTSILTSKGTYSFTEIFILNNPPSGAKVITATVNAASNYLGGNICDGVAGNSIALAGVGKIGALDIESASGIAMAQTIAANTNAIVVQGFSSEHPSAATGATITSYNKTSDYYSGNYVQGIKNVSGVNLPVGGAFLMGHATGAASVGFSANETASGDNYYGIAVAFFPSDPAPMGSCLRVFRASTSASTPLAAQTPTKLAANFFDTSTGASAYVTSDLTWDATNNRVTAANAGSYVVTLTLSLPNVTASSYFSAALFKNGVLARLGTTVYVPANANVNSTLSTTFQIYLNANDYIEVGAMRSISTSGSSVFIGDAAGTLSTLEVSLANRSLN